MLLPAENLDAVRRSIVRCWRGWLSVLAGAIFLGRSALAQDALRASLAGEDALEQQKKAVANQDYNLKMGDLKLRFQTSLSVEANDNVNLTQANRQSDMSIRPEIDVTALWPVSDRNTMALTLGGGYEKYLRTKALDSLFLTPDSTLSFNIYAGDFLINLHTHFVYSEQQYQNVDVSGSGNYNYFEDLTGFTTTWDLNDLKLTLSYDHDIYRSGSTGFSYVNRSSELVSLRAGLAINPTTIVGLELGGSLANYDQKPTYVYATNAVPVYIYSPSFNAPTNVSLGSHPWAQNQAAGSFLGDQQSVNLGPFIESSLSKFMQVKASAGYTIYFLGQSSFAPYPGQVVSFYTTNLSTGPLYAQYAPAASSSLSAFYTDITLTHAVNAKIQYTLSTGHQIRQGVYSDTLDLYYFYLTPTFSFIRNVSLQTPLNYEYAQRTGTQAENYHHLEAGIAATYQLNQKLSVGASYYYRMKQSDVRLNDFIQNQLVLNLHYSL